MYANIVLNGGDNGKYSFVLALSPRCPYVLPTQVLVTHDHKR